MNIVSLSLSAIFILCTTYSVIIQPSSCHNKTHTCHHPIYYESEQTLLYVATCVIARAQFITWRLVVKSSHLHGVGGVGE